MERDGGQQGTARLDVPGLIRRARRVADLSQRALAGALGVPQSVVARWETGAREPSLDQFQRLLALAGLHVEVRDAADERVEPMRHDTVRDRARRHYPAHLDAEPLDQFAPERLQWKPVQLDVLCRHTEARDAHRLRSGGGVPIDHPTHEEVVAELRARRDARGQRLRLLLRRIALAAGRDPDAADNPDDLCTCPIECETVPGCVPECPCGCERPPGWEQ